MAGATIVVGACCARSVAWSPDGQRLAVGVADTLHVVRRDGAPLATLSLHGPAVTGVAWSPDGRTVAVGCRDGVVRVYGATGRLRATLTGHTRAVTSVAWSLDGQLVASGSADGTVRIWQTNHALLTTVYGDAQPVQSVSWSPLLQLPYGRMVAIAAGHAVRLAWLDGTVRFTLSHLGATTSVAWSPNGHTIAIGSRDNRVRLLNPIGRLSATLHGHTAAVTSVAWSPNSTMFASGSLDKTVRVWGARGRALATLTGQRGGIYSVVWSPDGTTVASAGGDGTVHLWRLAFGARRSARSLGTARTPKSQCRTPTNREDDDHVCNPVCAALTARRRNSHRLPVHERTSEGVCNHRQYLRAATVTLQGARRADAAVPW
jgi:WD40 repeat protein